MQEIEVKQEMVVEVTVRVQKIKRRIVITNY